MADKDKCDLAGQIYKGRHPAPQGYDGRMIRVLDWCPVSDMPDRRRVLVEDTHGKAWATDADRVRAEIGRQESAERERLTVGVKALFENGACQDQCPDVEGCFSAWCPAMEGTLGAWVNSAAQQRQDLFETPLEELVPAV
jgi:hypothetical protein